MCGKCGATDWIGEVTVSPPTEFWANAWTRRTTCKHCGWAQDEIRSPGMLALTSLDQPIDWRGSNPFEGDAVDEEDGE